MVKNVALDAGIALDTGVALDADIALDTGLALDAGIALDTGLVLDAAIWVTDRFAQTRCGTHLQHAQKR